MHLLQSTFIASLASRPWWLHGGKKILGRVLASENMDEKSLASLNQLSQELCCFNSKDEGIYISTVDAVSSDITQVADDFDVIIVDSLSGNNHLILDKLYDNYLKPNGIILILEPNQYYFSFANKNIYKWFLNLFMHIRRNELKKYFLGAEIKQYCSHSRDGSVRYSYKAGLYESNKNAFLLKEKIKRMVYNSPFYRAFHNSNIWVISKGNETDDLEAFIVKNGCGINDIVMNKEARCSGLFYKLGKVILTFKNGMYKKNNIVVVIALSDTAIAQRNNEMSSIELLSQIPELKKYFKSKTYKHNFNGFNCYFMEQTPGVTVDVLNSNLNTMTNNAYKAVFELAKYTQQTINKQAVFEQLIKGYSDNIIARVPNCAKDINALMGFLFEFLSRSTFPCVCLHGDMKLENFVLSKTHTVEGIIDWELCELKSFPLLDLLYLIIYNHQSAFGHEFSDIFIKLWEANMDERENNWINHYCIALNISEKDRQVLLMVFFMHHYGQRFLISEDEKEQFKRFSSLLTIMVNFIS